MAQVLVVDDAAVMRQMLKQILNSQDIEVDTAKDGVEALAKIRQDNNIRIVFSDVYMPNMDGRELVETLAQEGIAERLSIFMLTTETDPELKKTFKAHGVSGWIAKPVHADTLLDVVKGILS